MMFNFFLMFSPAKILKKNLGEPSTVWWCKRKVIKKIEKFIL
jgi:hypothetical protein